MSNTKLLVLDPGSNIHQNITVSVLSLVFQIFTSTSKMIFVHMCNLYSGTSNDRNSLLLVLLFTEVKMLLHVDSVSFLCMHHTLVYFLLRSNRPKTFQRNLLKECNKLIDIEHLPQDYMPTKCFTQYIDTKKISTRNMIPIANPLHVANQPTDNYRFQEFFSTLLHWHQLNVLQWIKMATIILPARYNLKKFY